MNVRVILVPYDSGHHRKRMGLGPERIYEAGLKPLFTKMGVTFDCVEIALEAAFPAEIAAAFEICRGVSLHVRKCREQGWFPIVLSGNCGVAVGTVSGCGAGETGVVWFDAHGEATTPETTTSGFLDGMGISTLAGQCWRTLAMSIPGYAPVPGDRVFLFGARDLEDAECELLNNIGVHRPSELAELRTGLTATPGVDRIYVHFDFDVLDPLVAKGNQWTPPGGISMKILADAIAEAGKMKEIAALGIASYNPAVDIDGRALAAAMAATESTLRSLNDKQPLR
jgi:arginase